MKIIKLVLPKETAERRCDEGLFPVGGSTRFLTDTEANRVLVEELKAEGWVEA